MASRHNNVTRSRSRADEELIQDDSSKIARLRKPSQHYLQITPDFLIKTRLLAPLFRA